MPFKLRLKKSRQYNVVSKSLFVICIELLDSSSTECTLTSESTGRECLENVCQRLGLQQTEFFGLRYISKNNNCPRWIELERPLKRQLDKYAKDNGLYLRVMFYISNIGLIQDEMTRYHYFLQLKNDVIEDRIQCNIDDSVILASYCMQAEFGNYNSEKHTPDYLKDFALFPKELVLGGLLERLTDAVIQQYAALVGLAAGTAEEYYILAAQQLDGYGQETFLVKDEHGLETILGVTLKGIIVNSKYSTTFYKWSEIVNVINHKKNFGIECQHNETIVNFVFPDVESAKYVWRMCVHQHTFFMSCEADDEDGGGEEGGGPKNGGTNQGGGDTSTGGGRRQLFQNVDVALLSSREELDEPLSTHASMNNIYNYRHPNTMGGGTVTSREEIVDINERRNSTLDLVDSSPTSQQDLDKLRSMLPSYRPAPDYATAIQEKYKSDQHQLMYSSQPEIHTPYPDVTQHYTSSGSGGGGGTTGGQTQHRNVLHTYSTPDLDKQMFMLHVFKSPPPYPMSSNSTPDLASQSTPDLAAAVHHHQTVHPMNSSGGPGGQHFVGTQHVSGSSPDLVSTRTTSILNQTGATNTFVPHCPETHRTYANLANIISSSAAQTQMFEEKNLLYHHYLNNNNAEANNMLIQYLKNKSNLDATNQQQQQHRLNTNNVKNHEPIYENVPLPWQQQQTQPVNSNLSNQNEQKHLPSHLTHPPGVGIPGGGSNAKVDVQRTKSVESSSRKSSTANSCSGQLFENVVLNQNVQMTATSTSTTSGNVRNEMQRTKSIERSGRRSNRDNVSNAIVNSKKSDVQRTSSSENRTDSTHHLNNQMLENVQGNRELLSRDEYGQRLVREERLSGQFVDNVRKQNVEVSSRHLQEQIEKGEFRPSGKGSHRVDPMATNIDVNNDVGGRTNETKSGSGMRTTVDEQTGVVGKASRHLDDAYLNRIEPVFATTGGATAPRLSLSTTTSMPSGQMIKPVPNISVDNVEVDGSTSQWKSVHKSKPLNKEQTNKSFLSATSGSFVHDSSNISHVSSESTSSTNTVDKRKKKWSGFLSGSSGGSSSGSGGGTSSKTKTNSLPKFDDRKRPSAGVPNAVVSKETMCQILEKKLCDQSLLFYEFDKIPKVPKTSVDYSVSTNVENVNRNRYKDILPYEENRVRLTPKRDNRFGYINASHITATVGNEQRFYIAAQSPLTNTIEHFWDMIWEMNVYLLVNLNQSSSNTSDSVKYIPDRSSNKIIDVNEFRVSTELAQETGHCVTCKLKLTHTTSKRHRSVWYLEYNNWNSSAASGGAGGGSTPESIGHFLGFLEEISSIREHIATEIPCGHNKNPPTLIHCLDGVDKTGVTILCDLLLYLLDHNEHVEMPRILLSLRNQRMKFVSSMAQYSFVHSLLINYLKQSRLI